MSDVPELDRQQAARSVEALSKVYADDTYALRELYFGMGRLEAARRADELLESFDLATKAETKPTRLWRDAPSGADRARSRTARGC